MVAAQAQEGGIVGVTFKLPRGFVGQVTGRAYSCLFNGFAVKVFLIGSGMFQVVLGIHDVFFILVTEKTEARFFVFFDYEQILFDCAVMDLVTGLTYDLSLEAQFCTSVQKLFLYGYIDGLHIDYVEWLPFAFRCKYFLVLMACQTESGVSGALYEKTFIVRAMNCMTCLAYDLILLVSCLSAPGDQSLWNSFVTGSDRMIAFCCAAVLVCVAQFTHRRILI